MNLVLGGIKADVNRLWPEIICLAKMQGIQEATLYDTFADIPNNLDLNFDRYEAIGQC